MPGDHSNSQQNHQPLCLQRNGTAHEVGQELQLWQSALLSFSSSPSLCGDLGPVPPNSLIFQEKLEIQISVCVKFPDFLMWKINSDLKKNTMRAKLMFSGEVRPVGCQIVASELHLTAESFLVRVVS